MNKIIEQFETAQMGRELPAFAAGVTLAKDDYVYLGAFKHINTIDTTSLIIE